MSFDSQPIREAQDTDFHSDDWVTAGEIDRQCLTSGHANVLQMT